MELSPYVSALRENLTAAAAAGDEQTRTAARVLAATIEPAARLAIMNALSDLAGEVTLALEDRVVEVGVGGADGGPPGIRAAAVRTAALVPDLFGIVALPVMLPSVAEPLQVPPEQFAGSLLSDISMSTLKKFVPYL